MKIPWSAATGPTMDELVLVLSCYRFNCASEAVLQHGISLALQIGKIEYQRELHLSPQDRPDFIVAGGIAIEVKIGGSTQALTRQIHRYAQFDEVTGILVVTTRMQHRAIGIDALNGKPVRVLHLMGSVL